MRPVYRALLLLCLTACTVSADERVYRSESELRLNRAYLDARHVDLADEDRPSSIRDMLHVMPKLETLVVGGPRLTDGYLRDFARIDSLRALILDSTDVTDDAIDDVRNERPDLTIYRSQRRAIEAIRKLGLEVIVETRKNDDHPALVALLGERYFKEATAVDFRKLPDDESGPFDKILNEELAPLRMLPTVEKLDLKWTRINDGGLHYLTKLTKLESLRIPLDEVSPEGRERLKNLRPWKELVGTVDREVVLRVRR